MMNATQIKMNGKIVTEIKVYWDSQDRSNEGWAYSVSGQDSVLASDAIDMGADACLDDVIDAALWDAGIEGLTHDDFAKELIGGGYATWSNG